MTIMLASGANVADFSGRTLDAVVVCTDSLVHKGRTYFHDAQKIFPVGNFVISGAGELELIYEAVKLVCSKNAANVHEISELVKTEIEKDYKTAIFISGPSKSDFRNEGRYFPDYISKYPLEYLVVDLMDGKDKSARFLSVGSGKRFAKNAWIEPWHESRSEIESYMNIAEIMVGLYDKAVEAEKDRYVNNHRQWAIQVRMHDGAVETHSLFSQALKSLKFEERIKYFNQMAFEKSYLWTNKDSFSENDLFQFFNIFEMQLANAGRARRAYNRVNDGCHRYAEVVRARVDYLREIRSVAWLAQIIVHGDLDRLFYETRKEVEPQKVLVG